MLAINQPVSSIASRLNGKISEPLLNAAIAKVAGQYRNYMAQHGKPANRTAAVAIIAPFVEAAVTGPIVTQSTRSDNLNDVRDEVTIYILVNEAKLADYGCYFFIDNPSSFTLTREAYGADWGSWVGEPPQYIRGGTYSQDMHIKDNFGFAGSDGWVEYDGNGETLRFHVACPTVGSNVMEASSSAGTNSCFRIALPDPIPGGHPMEDTAVFTVFNNF